METGQAVELVKTVIEGLGGTIIVYPEEPLLEALFGVGNFVFVFRKDGLLALGELVGGTVETRYYGDPFTEEAVTWLGKIVAYDVL